MWIKSADGSALMEQPSTLRYPICTARPEWARRTRKEPATVDGVEYLVSFAFCFTGNHSQVMTAAWPKD